MNPVKNLIAELMKLLEYGAYKGNEQAFDRLADLIRNEEKGEYYAKHPEETRYHA